MAVVKSCSSSAAVRKDYDDGDDHDDADDHGDHDYDTDDDDDHHGWV